MPCHSHHQHVCTARGEGEKRPEKWVHMYRESVSHTKHAVRPLPIDCTACCMLHAIPTCRFRRILRCMMRILLKCTPYSTFVLLIYAFRRCSSHIYPSRYKAPLMMRGQFLRLGFHECRWRMMKGGGVRCDLCFCLSSAATSERRPATAATLHHQGEGKDIRACHAISLVTVSALSRVLAWLSLSLSLAINYS
jgi:hypothetical protein